MLKKAAIVGLTGLLAQSLLGASALAQTRPVLVTPGATQSVAYPLDLQTGQSRQVMIGEPVTGGVRQDVVTTTATPLQRVVALPGKTISGTINAPIGAVQGVGHQTVNSFRNVSDKTFKKIVQCGDTPLQSIGRGLVLVPAGIIGTAVTVPVGAVVGAVQGTTMGFTQGFRNYDGILVRQAAVQECPGVVSEAVTEACPATRTAKVRECCPAEPLSEAEQAQLRWKELVTPGPGVEVRQLQ